MADPTQPYGKGTRVPAIPDVRTQKLEDVLRAVKEWIEVRQGSRGDGLDRAVTFRDLLNTRVAGPGDLNGSIDDLPPIPLLPGDNDPAIPPTPTNLAAAGAISTIILTWDFARGYSRLAYFEVWRSETDALGDAVLIGQVFEPMYADEVGPGAKYYYWVRAVSDAGMSPFNAVLGTLGETALNVEEVIEAITGEINDSGLLDQLTVKVDSDGKVSGYGLASTPAEDDGSATTFAVLANRFLVAAPASAGIIDTPPFTVQTVPTTVNGVAVPKGVYMTDAYIMNGVITNAKIGNLAVDDAKIASMSVAKLIAGKLSIGAYIESTNYATGDTGFIIHGDGNAEFNNATVRGGVYATYGLIGGVTINENSLQSSNYNGTSAGWRISANGDVNFNQGTFRGALSAATGTFAGSLSAATGTFTGQVQGGEFLTGGYTEYAWPPSGQIGSYLGPNGLLLGNATDAKYFQVTSTGDLYAPGISIVNGVMTIDAVDVIDTLQVRGNAITVPAGTQATSQVNMSYGVWYHILTLGHTFNGQPVYISCTVDGRAWGENTFDDGSWYTELDLELRLTSDYGAGDIDRATAKGTTLTFQWTPTGVTTTTYKLWARIAEPPNIGSPGSWAWYGFPGGVINRRTMFVMGVKR